VGIKTLCFRKCSLVNLEGRGLLGKTGVDARILELWVIMTLVWASFQGSSERGIIVVAADKASKAMIELEKNSKMISILKMSIDYGCRQCFSDFDYWTRFEHVSQALYSFD
jgi:hypothetical protein